jgi:hypothetical protein
MAPETAHRMSANPMAIKAVEASAVIEQRADAKIHAMPPSNMSQSPDAPRP